MRESRVQKAESLAPSWQALKSAFRNWGSASLKTFNETSSYAEKSSPTEKELANSSASVDFVDLSTQDLQDFSQRLQMLWNTWWQAGHTLKNIPSFVYQNMTFAPPAASMNKPLNTRRAEVLQVDGEVYVSHWVYCILLFAISIVLLAISITTIVLQR